MEYMIDNREEKGECVHFERFWANLTY